MSACHVSSKSRGRVKIGSVSHELIQLCLQHYNIPVRERNYIKSLYSQLNGKIATKNWVSDLFEFLKDIFQGDPYSPTIFLVIFQPLIDYIQLHRETHGYQLGKAKVLTTPFADDFDLITNNCKKHQKLQLDVQRKAESMGLCFKPSKCRSLSIKRGQVNGEHKFFLLTGGGEEVSLKTKEDDPHKFLGSHITNFNSPADHFNFLKSKLEEKLANLDTTLDLDLLDACARKYLKSWLGFPKRGATDLGISHPNILGVKYPSQVYLESHVVNHINLTLSEDPVVKEAVTCQLEREGAWKKKSSTAVQCQTILDQIAQTTAIPFQESCPNAHTKRLQTKKVKAVCKKLITEIISEQSNEKADKLESQGAVACLLAEEKKDIPWQSVIFAVP